MLTREGRDAQACGSDGREPLFPGAARVGERFGLGPAPGGQVGVDPWQDDFNGLYEGDKDGEKGNASPVLTKGGRSPPPPLGPSGSLRGTSWSP